MLRTTLAMRAAPEFSSLGDWRLRAKSWLATSAPWWATSIAAHAVAMSLAVLLLGSIAPRMSSSQSPIDFALLDAPVETETTDFAILDRPEIEQLDLSLQLEPATVVSDQLLVNSELARSTGEPGNGDDESQSTALPGLVGLEVIPGGGFERGKGPGPAGAPGISGRGVGSGPGGFSHRGKPGRGSGMTPRTQSAVGAALNWIARHQNSDGSWSLDHYEKACKDATCTGHGTASADSAATALALLPFLAAGQTHRVKGPYRQHIYSGLYWLTVHQKPDGDLSAGTTHQMYSHGLATITLCEAYGMTRDKQLGAAAQQAIHFIEMAQNKGTGGWRYKSGDPGDTSVVGWQVMALKSGQMAGLAVSSTTMEGAAKWLLAASTSRGGLFCYSPVDKPAPDHVMSSVGLLCTQYLGARRSDPAIQEGIEHLLTHLPESGSRNVYYWYYATQVMHNLPGAEWDQWNRSVRRVLTESQSSAGCARGSWDPTAPTKDAWADPGGRLMVTCLSCLTLEVYYRYLPLYGESSSRE